MKTRKRSVEFLKKWQQAEKMRLRVQCRQHGVLFTRVTPHQKLPGQVASLLRDFINHSETCNLRCAQDRLDKIIAEHPDQHELTQVVILDGDRTLTEVDTGNMFWEEVLPADERPETYILDKNPLKIILSSSGYSYTAFRQIALLYGEVAGAASDEERFKALCEKVAASTPMYPEFKSLLTMLAHQKHTKLVIVTCGLRAIWEEIIKNSGLRDLVHVVGGGRLIDGFVVTPEVKVALVTRLKQVHKKHVRVFGDSLLDLDMLKVATRRSLWLATKRRGARPWTGPSVKPSKTGPTLTKSSSPQARTSHVNDSTPPLSPYTTSPALSTSRRSSLPTTTPPAMPCTSSTPQTKAPPSSSQPPCATPTSLVPISATRTALQAGISLPNT